MGTSWQDNASAAMAQNSFSNLRPCFSDAKTGAGWNEMNPGHNFPAINNGVCLVNVQSNERWVETPVPRRCWLDFLWIPIHCVFILLAPFFLLLAVCRYASWMLCLKSLAF